MESWAPLFDIFLNSPTPETDASRWLMQSFNASLSSTSASSPPTPINTSSFLSLLAKPIDAIVADSSPPTTKRWKYPIPRFAFWVVIPILICLLAALWFYRVMFMQTLPDMVQSRILSFLAVERDKFCRSDLFRLARSLLGEDREVGFWVKRAALQLLDEVPQRGYKWISGFGLGSEEGGGDEEFDSVPDWLKDAAVSGSELFLPWLPVSREELDLREVYGGCESEEVLLSQVGEDGGDILDEVVEDMELDHPENAPIDLEIQNMAAGLRMKLMNFESSSKTISLANEIRQLCLEKGVDSFAVLSLIQPWKADDESASVLISHLADGKEDLAWPSQVLCSIALPKMLLLEEPAPRVLVTAIVEYCKIYQRAAEYALLFPLVMRNGGVNNPICDVITRIIKECLHPAHVSAFCQKLLSEKQGQKRSIFLPCHQCLISNDLVWTESLFNLFHNILNHNIQLTQDSVDHLVLHVRELAQKFSRSLKFGNFLLCLTTKCPSLVKSHKLLLSEAVEQTNTLVTKSLLSKLASL